MIGSIGLIRGVASHLFPSGSPEGMGLGFVGKELSGGLVQMDQCRIKRM